MKRITLGIFFIATALVVLVASKESTPSTNDILTSNFIEGNTGIASINALSFGPEGILFIGDSKNAAIYALDTKDNASVATSERIGIGEVDEKIAASLGTTTDNIRITDMAVNPVSKAVYFSVNVTDGTPVILKLKGESFENVSLTDASFSKIELENAIAVDAKDHRNRPQRVWAISDLRYHDGNVLVSGLSNKEFSSTFRSIPFPFKGNQDYASLEIWHAAHGKYETHAPIKTFDVIKIEGKDYLMASYTCTPLVLFPMEDIKGGKHLKGRTVAELGAGNSPLDMISFEKGGQQYFFMSNTNRPIMRFKYETIADFKDTMTEPVTEFGVATGVAYDNLPMVNVLQLDNLDAEKVVYMQRTSSGDLILRSRPKRWM
ncbi:MAG: hypothetical protein ED556_08215 [Winogradskyella sp.]|uniref:hypothetical protein n=1 Tax=Winogradskyella sp. TaxID=1883156 RepID=UPI000F3CF2A6|nr:hypothetical protein [Winogradskyella sp.]RNC86271.1 MAG: hypothetical protein ED556_08215 [Winogradskyella sp.]